MAAAAREFLADAGAVEAFLEVDRRREPALSELHDAFVAFRDADESIQRLARRIKRPLWETRGVTNLWGFQNEDERLFPERFAAAAPRLPDVDLASVFRSYLQDDPKRSDDQRIQLLLAFGEFVASLDARAEGDARLGVGPAANFLTFAWHCLSMGEQPVFLYSTNRAVKAFDEKAGAGDGSRDSMGQLERRFRTFFDLSRTMSGPLAAAPPLMRRGWAIEHALEWILDRYERTGQLPAAEGRRAQGNRPVIIVPSGAAPATSPRIERPRVDEPPRVEEPEPTRAEPPQAAPTDASRRLRGGTERYESDDTRARQRARIEQLSTKKKVVFGDAGQMVERSGVEFNDALPADRTPPVGVPRPEVALEEPEKRKGGTSRFDRGEVMRVEPPRAPEPPKPEPPKPEPPKPEPPKPAPMGADRTEELDEALADVAPASRAVDLDDESNDVALDALLGELRGEVVHTSRGEPARVLPTDRLAHDLYLDPALTTELQAALEQRGRVALVGPPWSGKTHVARRLAIHLAGHIDRILFLRLHPDLSYADLMGREPGIVRTFCERARDDHHQRYALVLDELDRGDAARALGELVGALADRGQDVALGRTGAPFHVPRNLLTIATARDLPCDPALVARFPVVPLPADPEVLRRYLAQCRPAMEWVADLLRTLNARLTAEGRAAQVGHGVFMDPDLDADRLRLIWRREVVPLLTVSGVERETLDFEALRGSTASRGK